MNDTQEQPRRVPKSRQAGIDYRNQSKAVKAPAAVPEPHERKLSEIDGPLSHLLQERHFAQVRLREVELRVEALLVATQYLVDQAQNKPGLTPLMALPPQVLHWVREIEARRGMFKPTQRAD